MLKLKLTLKNGTEVKIVSESENVVKVVSKYHSGFDCYGNEYRQTYTLSKRLHKGHLLLGGVAII